MGALKKIFTWLILRVFFHPLQVFASSNALYMVCDKLLGYGMENFNPLFLDFLLLKVNMTPPYSSIERLLELCFCLFMLMTWSLFVIIKWPYNNLNNKFKPRFIWKILVACIVSRVLRFIMIPMVFFFINTSILHIWYSWRGQIYCPSGYSS